MDIIPSRSSFPPFFLGLGVILLFLGLVCARLPFYPRNISTEDKEQCLMDWCQSDDQSECYPTHNATFFYIYLRHTVDMSIYRPSIIPFFWSSNDIIWALTLASIWLALRTTPILYTHNARLQHYIYPSYPIFGEQLVCWFTGLP